MDIELRSVHEHMLGLGLGALAHANWHAHFNSPDNEYWPQLSVLQAAHAAEILLKARIAQEHPLLILDRVPLSTQVDGTLSLRHLFERGRTIQYAELPERLWAATGLQIENTKSYKEFGELRNTIQHFGAPDNCDFSLQTSRFIYGVVDLFINRCWRLFAIDYCEDSAGYEYLIPGLLERGILFLVPPQLDFGDFGHFRWPEKSQEYRVEMERRFRQAHLARKGNP